MLAVATAFGPGSVFAFWVFLLTGPIDLAPIELKGFQGPLLNMTLSLLFFLQHSILIRKPFRLWASRFVPPHYYGPLYAITGGGILVAIMTLWQESRLILVAFDGPDRWFFYGLYCIALAGFFSCMRALQGIDAFGLKALSAHLAGTTLSPPQFIVRGPYRWIRHPVYFFWIVMLWSSPTLSADRLMLNVLWTGWLILATFLEDRDLATAFGAQYADYQRQVPMLLPRTIIPAFTMEDRNRF